MLVIIVTFRLEYEYEIEYEYKFSNLVCSIYMNTSDHIGKITEW